MTVDQMQIVHLRREVKTALELAVVAFAPAPLVDGLAVAAGLLEAVSELPADVPALSGLASSTVVRATKALERWRAWQDEHGPRTA
jgi:hypothetical protein